jgi:hypothetical protein
MVDTNAQKEGITAAFTISFATINSKAEALKSDWDILAEWQCARYW